jgi:hypothetical protein
LEDALRAGDILDAWRAAHQVPLARFTPVLEESARAVFGDAVVVSRLKRAPTILDKLQRLPRLPLWQYQDIGGLRAIVDTPLSVAKLAQVCVDHPPIGFQFKRPSDYMTKGPKDSGYGGIHLIYSYSAQEGEDAQLNGLKIEVQLRTAWQHAWATTNEIVDFITKQNMKGGRGNPDWLRFFELAGSVVADTDGYPRGKNIPKDTEQFRAELVALNNKLRAVERISGWSLAPSIIDTMDPKTFRHLVLTFDVEQRSLQTFAFGAGDFAEAASLYRKIEEEHRGNARYDTVLASADSIEEVRRGLPNYFADSGKFVDLIIAATKWKDPRKPQ